MEKTISIVAPLLNHKVITRRKDETVVLPRAEEPHSVIATTREVEMVQHGKLFSLSQETRRLGYPASEKPG